MNLDSITAGRKMDEEELFRDEISFLETHGLSASDVFDGRGYYNSDIKILAKEQGKTLFLGNACNRAGHRLRTRSGHCVQCDDRKLVYQTRFNKTGYIYIAGSLSKKLIKIGGTTSIANRKKSLRSQGYAGAHDWEMLFWLGIDNFGRLESDTQNILSDYAVLESYEKEGRDQSAYEVFRCPYSSAKVALSRAMKNGEYPISDIGGPSELTDYEF